jgi:hypothetical protein
LPARFPPKGQSSDLDGLRWPLLSVKSRKPRRPIPQKTYRLQRFFEGFRQVFASSSIKELFSFKDVFR